MLSPPILYSFEGCPFCLRTRIALKYANLKIIVREVELDNLPEEALAVSSHATVPSLVISDSEYLDESWDIVKWAVQQDDPNNWLGRDNAYLQDAEMLVEISDHSFKEDLKGYKNPASHQGQPEQPMEYYRDRGEEFLEELNEMLEENNCLLAPAISVADIAVFPLVHEFAMVDKDWFDKSAYPKVQGWLAMMLEKQWYKDAMQPHELWHPGNKDIYL